MPNLQIYPQAVFPAVYRWQAIAFMRMEWPEIFQGDIRYLRDPYPPELDPVHFVVAEGDSLISYATIMRQPLAHAGVSYRIHGLGNVFTFPPYRCEGFGRQVVAAATHHILCSDVDLAILFCDPALEAFYAAHGWGLVPDAEHRAPGTMAHGVSMALFVSPKGHQGREDFRTQPIQPDWTW